MLSVRPIGTVFLMYTSRFLVPAMAAELVHGPFPRLCPATRSPPTRLRTSLKAERRLGFRICTIGGLIYPYCGTLEHRPRHETPIRLQILVPLFIS